MALISPLRLTFVLKIAACILNGRSLTVELEERLSDYKRIRQVSGPIAPLLSDWLTSVSGTWSVFTSTFSTRVLSNSVSWAYTIASSASTDPIELGSTSSEERRQG